MCCNRRNNRRALTVAKLAHDHLIANSRAAHNGPMVASSRAAPIEPLGPPPAYEQIEKDSKTIIPSKDIPTTKFIDHQELSPEYTTRGANVDYMSNNTTMLSARPTCQSRCAAKREMKQLKREHRQEHRLEKREYRQEKRELRAEYRFEKKEMRRERGGPISMLIKGVSNLMTKQ
ncbi:hypothetical protein M436DRAFT_61580 [Aureobasidium namibiae CBS 147.97]|uniref:Uncharacterized protein n=1 Tax=Aureobasidium namibiae CBS 147.97 TaxID=1043004 RepID=A0A074WXU3_9PEZI